MAPGGLVEVCVSWPGHPHYLKKELRRKRQQIERLKGTLRCHMNVVRMVGWVSVSHLISVSVYLCEGSKRISQLHYASQSTYVGFKPTAWKINWFTIFGLNECGDLISQPNGSPLAP